MKISISGTQARDKIIKGASYLSSVVGSTLGPHGQNVLLEKGNRATNDGYTISAELAGTIKDEFERRGALVFHEVSSKTNDEVGDATTSSEVLALAILNEAVRYLPNEKTLIAKKKPSEIVQMIETSRLNVISKLEPKTIETKEELIASAKVSVEDDELAQLIGSIQWEIGKDGFIIAEETIEPKSSIQIVKGIRIDNGFGTPIVITNQATQSLELKDVSVLLTNYTLQKDDILRLKDKVFSPLILQKKLALVIIARAFSAEAIQLCTESMKAGFAIFPINAPYTHQSEIMKDLAAITGANYYDTEETRLEDISITDIGFATEIRARRFDAIIMGQENNEAIQERISQLEEKLNGTAVSDFEKKTLQARIAQFKGGFAILKIGADTVFERQYKMDKATDAVNSVRLALQGGTIKGAGLAFKEISDQLPDDDILKRPLLSIYNQIMTTAPEGFVIEEWVRDPYLTLVSALTNACSVAGMFSTVNAVITSENPPKFNLQNLQYENEE
jgi:chaperonin GroEL